jgi:hypothetical protein
MPYAAEGSAMVDTGDTSGGGRGQYDIAAQPVIDAFGGIRPMAAKLGVPVSTVQGWKQRDTIPASRVESIAAAARVHGVTMPDSPPATALPTAAPAAAASGPAGASPAVPPAARPAGSGLAESRPPAPGPSGYRGAGPRPGIRFSRPEDFAEAAAPSAAAPPPPAAREPVPAQADVAPPAPHGRPPAPHGSGRATGALVLAALALVVAVLWPILFASWFGADAQEGGEPTAALAERLTVLEQAAGDGGSEALQEAVAALRSELDALKAAGDGSTNGIDALSTRIAALEQAAGTPAAIPEAVGAALESLERAVGELDRVVDGMETRIAGIEAEVGRLEGAGDAAAVDQLRTALASVQATLDQVQGNLQQVTDLARSAREEAVTEATAAIDREVDALGDRISALAGADDTAAAHQSFLIALGQLEARLGTAQPFADQLAALQQVAAGSPTLAGVAPAVDAAFAPLADAAATGVPTLAALRAGFDDTRLAVLNATDAPPEDTLDEIWDELSGMVTVSRVDEAGSSTVDGILATAEGHLAAGDLASAADALDGLGALGPGYAAAAAPWIADARLRLAADQAMDTVQQAALASFRPELPAAGDPGADVPAGADAPSGADAPAGAEGGDDVTQ